MRKTITSLVLSIGLIFLFAAASPERKIETKNITFTCSMSASPTQLDFGLRNQPDPYQINVTSNTYWEFYTQNSWLRVNNQTTYIGSNNQTVTITTNGTIPSGTSSGCDNVTTGHMAGFGLQIGSNGMLTLTNKFVFLNIFIYRNYGKHFESLFTAVDGNYS